MELLLSNYLGHWDILIVEKTFIFLFMESTIKPTLLPHANVQMPWCTECNQSNRWQPECFYELESPSQSFQSVIYTGPMGGCASMLGQINLQLMEELSCSKRLTDDCTIMNSEFEKVENIHSNNS